jgi:hypothetical protein
MIVDDPPLLDFLQRSEAAETVIVVVQTAVADAWGFCGAVDIAHEGGLGCEDSNFITQSWGSPGNASSFSQVCSPRVVKAGPASTAD